jgi:predicted ester cyclase
VFGGERWQRSSTLRNEGVRTSHFEDFVNKQRAELIDENMAPDLVDHNGPGEREVGIAEDEQMMRGMYERLPGIKVTIEDMVAENDKVVCRNVWRWKDEDANAMEFRGFVEWRFEGDKIAERWATVTQPQAAT